MPRLDYQILDNSKSVGIRTACSFGRVSQDLKQRTRSKRYPAFFLYVAKILKCYIPG